jgi:hypothetical protein
MDEIHVLIDRLEASPALFAGVMSRLEAADSVEALDPGDWSAAQVLAHVRASQDIIEPRILAILARDNPPLSTFDDRAWADVGRYAFVPVTEARDSMRTRRRDLIRALRALGPEEWQRTGQHEVRGPISVLDIARNLGEHEDEHLEQIARISTAYADANVEKP